MNHSENFLLLADCAFWFWDWRSASEAHYYNVPEHIPSYWYKYSGFSFNSIECSDWQDSVFNVNINLISMYQVKLSSCQRIVLLNYNKDTKLIDFRHYSIRLQPVGVTRRLRKFVQNHQVPDLRNLQDVSDFVTK